MPEIMSLDDYKAKLRTLSGDRLLDEFKMVIVWHRRFPDEAEGKERYAAAFEYSEESETLTQLWRIARLKLDGQVL